MKAIKIIILITALFLAADSYAQVTVVANKSISENSLTVSKLTDIYFLRAKSWSNGQAIVPFTLKTDNQVTDKFFSAIGKSNTEMKKIWMKLQLTGEGQAPASLGSDEETLNKVASTPGSIGFVDSKNVNDKVKTLLTIN